LQNPSTVKTVSVTTMLNSRHFFAQSRISMLSLLSVLVASLDLPANTSFIFPNNAVRITDSKGTVRTVYGGLFPVATKLTLAEEDLRLAHLTAMFPSTCSRYVVSTRPNVRGELVHEEGGSIVPELCVWYVSRPSLVRFTIRSRSGSRLILVAVDGAEVSKELAEGTLDIEITSDILFRWRNTGNAIDSFASFRAAQRDDSIPFKSNFSRIFNPSKEVEFFPATAARSGRDHGDSDGDEDEYDHEGGTSVVSIVITILAHVLIIACICGCCAMCCRAIKRRAQRKAGQDGQVPLNEVDEDAVPPVVRPPQQVPRQPIQQPIQQPVWQVQYLPVQGMPAPYPQYQYQPQFQHQVQVRPQAVPQPVPTGYVYPA
jgi:hypothetical protein